MRNKKREIVDVKRTKGRKPVQRQSIGIGEKRLPSLGKLVLAILVSFDPPIYLPLYRNLWYSYIPHLIIFKMVHGVLHSLLNLLTNKDANNSPLNAAQSPPTQLAPLNAVPNLLKKTTSPQTKKPISGKHSACLRYSIQIIRMQKQEY